MNMKVNLIICAMQEELNGILKYLKEVKKSHNKFSTIYEFINENEHYVLTLGKIGKVSTSLYIGYLSSIYEIKRVFNVGTAGALTSNVKIGDIVIATGVMFHDVDVTGFNYEEGQIPHCPKIFRPDEEYISNINLPSYDFKIHRGLIISGDTFITKNNIKKISANILKDALCGEMESAAVGECCYFLNIPFIIIRSISDYVLHSNEEEFDTNLNQVSLNAGKVLLAIIKY